MNEPQLHERAAQPYLAIAAHVRTETDFRRAADSGFPELFQWLREHGVAPSGPLFIRYRLLDDEGQPREIELAVPVGEGVAGDGRVRADVLPPGRWATLLHIGPYTSATAPDLAAARAALHDWAKERGVVLEGRVEHYIIGPVEEPDHSKWQTEIAYLTAGDAQS